MHPLYEKILKDRVTAIKDAYQKKKNDDPEQAKKIQDKMKKLREKDLNIYPLW